MRTLNNVTGLMFGIVIGIMLALSLVTGAHSKDLGLDAPTPNDRAPVAAESVICLEPNSAGQKVLWYVIMTFANGDTIVFNAHHMHGAASDSEAMEYVRMAKTQTSRVLPCPPQL